MESGIKIGRVIGNSLLIRNGMKEVGIKIGKVIGSNIGIRNGMTKVFLKYNPLWVK